MTMNRKLRLLLGGAAGFTLVVISLYCLNDVFIRLPVSSICPERKQPQQKENGAIITSKHPSLSAAVSLSAIYDGWLPQLFI
jgi:hypothetical protein